MHQCAIHQSLCADSLKLSWVRPARVLSKQTEVEIFSDFSLLLSTSGMSVGDSPFSPLPVRTNSVTPLDRRSVFDRLLVQAPVKHHKRGVSQNLPDLPSASVNMIGRGRESRTGRRAPHAVNSPPFSSSDPDYSPGLSQVLVHKGVFRNTRSRVAIPYSYEQPSFSTTVTSPEPMRGLFQWSEEENEDSGYASSATVSSVRTDRVSVNIADNGNDDLR